MDSPPGGSLAKSLTAQEMIIALAECGLTPSELKRTLAMNTGSPTDNLEKETKKRGSKLEEKQPVENQN